MLISASFLSSKKIPTTLTLLNQTDVDMIHVDVMDGKYVPSKTLPYHQMKHIEDYTTKRLDVHLMVEKPSHYIDDYANLNTEYITVPLNSSEKLLDNLQQIKSYAIKTGVFLNPETKIEEVVPYLPYLDLILIMGVQPGAGGQEFLPATIKKLQELKQCLKTYPNFSIKISVDGGVNDKTAPKMKNLIDILVSGSYITNSDDYQEKITTLRK